MRPVGCSIRNVKWLAQAMAWLHNLVINERMCLGGEEDLLRAAREGRGHLPHTPHEANGDPVVLDPIFEHGNMPQCMGHSELREHMVRRTERKLLKRPATNHIVVDTDIS